MQIGEFRIVIASLVDRDELMAEVSRDNYELATVYVENGKPIISLGPDQTNEYGVWTIDYHVFKQIIKELDKFLESIGHPIESS